RLPLVIEVEESPGSSIEVGEQRGQLALDLADHAPHSEVAGTFSNPDLPGVALPLKLVLADDLFGDSRVPPLEEEPDLRLEQGVHGGVGVAIAGVEADHEPLARLLEDGQGRTEKIRQPSRTDDVARIQVGRDCLRLAAWSAGQSS